MISNDPEYIELMNFLIERTKDANSSLSVKQLARDFKEINGSSLSANCLRQRIGIFRQKIHEMDSIDMTTKVRMLVALGASIDMDFLNEFRKDALVEVDEKNRITKYRANDGSLEMEGDHSGSAKKKLGWHRQKQIMNDSLDDSDNGSMTPTTKARGSTKIEAVSEVPSSSKRTRDSSPTPVIKTEDYDPDDSAGILESRTKEVVRRFSPQPSTLSIQQLRQPKLEEAPEPPEAQIPRETPFKTESGSDDAFTPQITFLEAIHSIVFNLDMPFLVPLQTKIEKKLLESPNAQIPNDEMILAFELLVAKITNHSVSNLPENLESVRLSNFLCYLKAAVSNSKLEGLEDLMEKVKRRIKEPASKDKNIPVEKVASALQTTLDVIGF